MDKIYTVSEFSKEVKVYLEGNERFKEVFIEGEISGITYYQTGHLYFTLKDKKSQLKCAAFRYKAKRIPEDLKEGELVKIFADVSFYEVRGDFQLLVRHIEKQNNLGALFMKLEETKKKLKEKGYFDESKKKKLPKHPRTIGVITAITGAAVHDIIKTAKKRNPAINIYVYPAKVQGVGSKEEIIKGIEVLNRIEEIDFIIAGRGGGSIEDLWSFNEEEVALAFFNSEKPIISAVGHETDFLLSDFTADFRAATPTQAIELSIPETDFILEDLRNKRKALNSLVLRKMESCREAVKRREGNYSIKNFPNLVNDKRQILVQKEKEISQIMRYNLSNIKNILEIRKNKISNLSPLKILERGYSVVTKNGQIIRDLDEVNLNDEVKIRIATGILKGNVTEKIKETEDEKTYI